VTAITLIGDKRHLKAALRFRNETLLEWRFPFWSGCPRISQSLHVSHDVRSTFISAGSCSSKMRTSHLSRFPGGNSYRSRLLQRRIERKLRAVPRRLKFVTGPNRIASNLCWRQLCRLDLCNARVPARPYPAAITNSFP